MSMTRRTFSLGALASGLFIGKRAFAHPNNNSDNESALSDVTKSGHKDQSNPMNNVKNLVFRGGGPLAFSYIGAMEVLDKKGLLTGIERTTGASAGALFATLVALNLTPEEMRDFMFSIKNPTMNLLTDLKIPENLHEHYGMLSTDYIIKPLEQLLEQKTGNKDITFSQLQAIGGFKKLYVVATDLSTTSSITFSHENPKLDISISKAVSASNALPIAYMSVDLEIKGKSHILVDGGVMRNFPIEEFDLKEHCAKGAIERADAPGKFINPATMGFFSDSTDPTQRQPLDERSYTEINGIFSFIKSIPPAMFEVQTNMLLNNEPDVHRSVFIANPTYVQDDGYEQTQEVKDQMVENGRVSTIKYFEALQHQA